MGGDSHNKTIDSAAKDNGKCERTTKQLSLFPSETQQQRMGLSTNFHGQREKKTTTENVNNALLPCPPERPSSIPIFYKSPPCPMCNLSLCSIGDYTHSSRLWGRSFCDFRLFLVPVCCCCRWPLEAAEKLNRRRRRRGDTCPEIHHRHQSILFLYPPPFFSSASSPRP